VLALQLRQPTLIFLSLLAAVYFWVQSGRLVLAGMLAALCAAKPQLAIAVLLPLSIWSVAAWRIRKAFVLSLGATLSVLLIAAEFAVPGWFAEWLATLAAYAHYAGGKPPLADLLCGHFVLPAAALLLGAAVCVSFKFQASDLLFAISFSAAMFQLLFPFQIYNAVLLFPAVLWLIANANTIMARGQLLTLLYSCTWIVLGAGWASAAGLSLSNVLVPGVRPDVLAASAGGGIFIPIRGSGLPRRLRRFQVTRRVHASRPDDRCLRDRNSPRQPWATSRSLPLTASCF
jgi:hypothetical protein